MGYHHVGYTLSHLVSCVDPWWDPLLLGSHGIYDIIMRHIRYPDIHHHGPHGTTWPGTHLERGLTTTLLCLKKGSRGV